MLDICLLISITTVPGLRKGAFVEDNKDLKCYTMCVAQMAGTLTKKNEISRQKTFAQIENLLPVELKAYMFEVAEACKNVQTGYKDPCDRTYYTAKCMYEFSPEKFLFP